MKRNIRLFYLVQFLTGLLFTIPVWVAFQQRFLTYSQMAVVESMAFLVTMLVEIPTGALADLIGRKKTIILGLGIVSLGYIVEGMAGGVAQIVIGIMTAAIGGAVISGADTAIAYDTHKQLGITEQFSKFNARSLILYRAGIIVASFLGGYMYSISPSIPYVARGVAGLISLVVYFSVQEPFIDSEKFSWVGYVHQTKEGIKELFKNVHTKTLSAYYILVGGTTWSCLYYFNNTFAKDVGFTEIQQGKLFSIIYILTTSIILYLTHRKKLLSRSTVYSGFLILLIFGLVPGIFASTTTAPILLTLVILAGGSRFAILDSYVNDEFESKHRATANSALNMLVNLVVFVVIISSGRIQEIYSSKLMFTILGGVTLVFLLPTKVALLRFKRP